MTTYDWRSHQPHVSLDDAEAFVKRIIDGIGKYCANVSSCGAIRRQEGVIYKIEMILALKIDIELMREFRTLINSSFGTPVKGGEFPNDRISIKTANQPKKLMIHVVREQVFPVALFYHTGPLPFVHRAYDYWVKQTGGSVEDYQFLKENGDVVQIATEAEIFDLLKCPYVVPSRRALK